MQLLLSPDLKFTSQFGGVLSLNKRKERRPIATTKAMHTVLRSNYRSLRRFKGPLSILLERQSKKWGIRLYKYSINSNHIHLCTKATHSNDYQNFLRTVTALSARLVTGAKKGKKLPKKFWALLPYSRIIEWGKAFKAALNYIFKNQLEASGVVSYTPRIQKLPTGRASPT
jgi:hypothetical protein